MVMERSVITLTREEAQKVLDGLEYAYDNEMFVDIRATLRTKLHEYPKNKVHPYEFLKAVEGKEDFVGMPIIWAEWPTKEEL
jgi:hypothetical protein